MYIIILTSSFNSFIRHKQSFFDHLTLSLKEMRPCSRTSQMIPQTLLSMLPHQTILMGSWRRQCFKGQMPKQSMIVYITGHILQQFQHQQMMILWYFQFLSSLAMLVLDSGNNMFNTQSSLFKFRLSLKLKGGQHWYISVVPCGRWAVVKDESVYQRMETYIQLSSFGVSRDTQLRALKLMNVVLETRGKEIFEFGFVNLKKRWEKLSSTLHLSNRFSLQKIAPKYCTYFQKIRGPSPGNILSTPSYISEKNLLPLAEYYVYIIFRWIK